MSAAWPAASGFSPWRRGVHGDNSMRPGLPLRDTAACRHCRVPPRQAGHFHLQAQMKVTKAKGLNTTPTWPSRSGHPAQRAASPERRTPNQPPARRCGSLRIAVEIRRAANRSPRAARSAPALLGGLRCRCATRVQSHPPGRVSGAGRPSGFRALCFGYFHLGLQMKVTRQPGRDPAMLERPKRPSNAADRRLGLPTDAKEPT